MKEFFPIDTPLIKHAFETATSSLHYDTVAQSWSRLGDCATDAQFYTGFVELATHITEAIRPADPVTWKDTTSSGNFKASDQAASGFRPGLVVARERLGAKLFQWADVIFPIEVRLHASDKLSGQPQLFLYTREVFCAQPNRRFCFAFLFIASEVEVWLGMYV